MKNIWIILIGLTLLISSCHKKAQIMLIDEISNAHKYASILDDWTKGTKHYYWNDVKFFVKVTYKSLPLRLAYVKEYSTKYRLPLEEQKAMYKQELEAYNNSNQFFVTIFSSEDDINNLRDAKKWRLYLKDGITKNVRLGPSEIKKVKVDAVVKHFYPHITPWTGNFLVTFPKTATDAQNEFSTRGRFATIDFLMASIVGEHSFQWKLADNDLER